MLFVCGRGKKGSLLPPPPPTLSFDFMGVAVFRPLQSLSHKHSCEEQKTEGEGKLSNRDGDE